MEGLVDGCIGGGWMDEWAHTDGCMEGVNEWMVVWVYGQTDGTDGWDERMSE
jgi:hypothetical protein